MTSPRVTVLGAGMVGAAIAEDLVRTDGFDVSVVDARADALAALARRAQVKTRCADLGSAAAVRQAVADADLVVGALASRLGLQTLGAVIEAGKPYCDISFMADDFLTLDGLAKERGVCAVVDCGVAPGVSNLLSGHAAAVLDPCETLEIYVGGLPVERRWPYNYKAGFAPHDVLEEYTRPARLVEHGQVVIKPALSEPELMDFPGVGTLEAFNTDGLRSLATTLKIPDMKERTLRYPGHIELMRVLRETGFFNPDPVEVGGVRVRPLDLTAALMFPKWTFGPGEADLTVMRIIATGARQGRRVRLQWELLDHYDPASDTRSMSRTTGYAATAMVALMAAGRVTRPGVLPPELLAGDAGLVDAFLGEYRRRGVEVRFSEAPL